MKKLACAADEVTVLAHVNIKAFLDPDWKGDFHIIERPAKNN